MLSPESGAEGSVAVAVGGVKVVVGEGDPVGGADSEGGGDD